MTWTKLMAMRHALTKYPDCKFIWYLDQDAYIMDPTKALEDIVLQPRQLESLMIRGQPVVPPDSIIKTYSYLRGEHIDVVLAQDKSGLVHNNIIIRNGEWAKFFLETWLDPLYRSYNFQKAERHALVRLTRFSGKATQDANRCKGTHCPVAPDHPIKTGSCAPAHVCLVCEAHARRAVPGRRLCCHVCRLLDYGQGKLRG